MNYTNKGATISDCGKYRYNLTRTWAAGKAVMFIGLNPSTANADEDDPTIRKCVNFADRWGYSSIVMTNLFAYRATDPKEMKKADDPVGPANDLFLEEESFGADLIVCAWGANGDYLQRDDSVVHLLKHQCGFDLKCLKLTKDGHPWHPLYVKYDTPLIEFK